jgi:hypothetical protein
MTTNGFVFPLEMEGAVRWDESDVLRVVVFGGVTAAVMVALVFAKTFSLRHG